MQLSAGSLRQKNARNIIFKNLMDACLGAVCFYLVGYGFAYGGENANRFIGWSGFALNGESFDSWYSWFFQYTVRIWTKHISQQREEAVALYSMRTRTGQSALKASDSRHFAIDGHVR